MAIDFHKWKAEPSGMHSHSEHGNEEKRALHDVLGILYKRSLKLEIGN